MKRNYVLYIFPLFTMVIGMLASAAFTAAAPFNAPINSGGNVTGCYLNASNSGSLTLGGRSVPPNSILRIVPAGCPSGETSLGLLSYAATVLVSPNGSPTQNGTALISALAAIPSPSAANPYLLKLEPGVFDLGTNSLNMRSFVDLEGSGEDLTSVTSSVSSATLLNSGTINGANNSEIRSLSIKNTGSGANSYALAFYNGIDATAKVSNAAILTTGTASSGTTWTYGIVNNNASPTIRYCKVSASGATGGAGNIAIYNLSNSSPTIQNSRITAVNTAGTSAYGIHNVSTSNPTIEYNIINVAGASSNYGVNMNNSSPVIRFNTISTGGSGGSYTVYIDTGTSPTIQHNTITAASTANFNYSVYNSGSAPVIQDNIISASGSPSNYAFYNTLSSQVIQNNVMSASGPSPSSNYGFINFNGTVKLVNNLIKGTSYSLFTSGGSVQVGGSHLDGPVFNSGGTLSCIFTYKADFTAASAACL